MNNIIAIFPDDKPRFVVGHDDFLEGQHQPFFAVHALSSSICLTCHNMTREQLQALADQILAYLGTAPATADDDADAEAACAEARRIAMERFDQMVAEYQQLDCRHLPAPGLPE